jgi:hypothetical protein
MSAKIIAFPCRRFTAVDAIQLEDLASAMIGVGAWGRVEYFSDGAAGSLGFDAVLIYLPDAVFPVFIIERHKNGNYALIDCATGVPLAAAKSLGGALAPLKPVIRRAEAEPGDAVPRRLQWNLW